MAKVDKIIYRLPLIERFTRIGLRGRCIGFKSKLMEVDGLGIYVYHNETDDSIISPEMVRRHLIGGNCTFCFVEADSEEEAKQKFLNEWDGAKVGSKSPALKLSDGEIVSYPPCSKRYRNREGGYTCGRPLHDIPEHIDQKDDSWCNNGEFGMCAIGGYDYPYGCPLDEDD